jgi:adhesin transport system membrane fusion protein
MSESQMDDVKVNLRSAWREGLHARRQQLLRWWQDEERNRVIWAAGATLLASLIWAGFFPLDVASYAQGQVIPAGQLKKIQHLEGGIVRDIVANEGQVVAAGDVILELEAVSADAEVGDIRSKIGSLEIKTARLEASLSGVTRFVVPPALAKDFPEFAKDALDEFRANQSRVESGIQARKSRIASRTAEIQEARERLGGLKRRAVLIAEQVKISERLLQQKLTSEYEHLQLKRDQEQIVSDRDAAVATETRATRQLEEEQASLQAFKSEEESNLRKNLQETTTELASLKERFRKPSDSQDRTTVRAPVAGTIQALYFKNRGAVVSPGGLIATMVPDGEALLVEGRLPIGDVGYVQIGAPARLSLSSGGSGYSTIKARVVHVSPDSMLDEKTGQSYYLVRLKPEEFSFRRGDEIYALRTGVQITCAILTGERSVLALLLEPFIGHGIRPLTER